MTAAAYYPTKRQEVSGWGTVVFQQVVESEGRPDAFVPGTSGSGVVTDGDPSSPGSLNLQSICLDPDVWTRGLGTTFARALEWVKNRLQTGRVALFWDPGNIPEV